MKKYLFALAVLCLTLSAIAQKRIVVIGSSTAEGQGSAPINEKSWVRLVSKYYKNELHQVDSVYNIAKGGTSIWWGMPSTSTFWMGRGGVAPNPDYNVSKALTLLEGLAQPSDGVIVVCFPTNDYQYSSITVANVMQCFRTIRDSATRYGNRCIISTTQPRTADAMFNTPTIKKKLAELKDSIMEQFGSNALDFWTEMTNFADTSIKAIYNSGDNIHFNNDGHAKLAELFVAAGIIPNIALPLVWGEFITLVDNDRVKLQWTTLDEKNTDRFVIEHSTDGVNYKPIGVVTGQGNSSSTNRYTYIHTTPNTNGNNFYRIREIDLNGQAYLSLTRVLQFKGRKGMLIKINPNPVGSSMQTNVSGDGVTLVVIDAAGRLVFKKTLAPGTHSLNMQGLPAGTYHAIVRQNGHQIESHEIIKL